MSKLVPCRWALIWIILGLTACGGKSDRTFRSNNTAFQFDFRPQYRLQGATALASATNNTVYKLALVNNRFFAFFGNNDDFIVSTDGATWTRPGYTVSLNHYAVDAFYRNGAYHVISVSSSSTAIRQSSDGASYGLVTVINDFLANSLAITPTQYVLVGTNSTVSALKIYTSADAVTWTERTPGSGGTGTQFTKVLYAKGTLVAVGVNGEIQTSLDGITWTRRAPAGGFDGVFMDIAYGLNTLIAVGFTFTNEAVIQSSTDGGLNWTEQLSGNPNYLYGLAFANNTFIAVGFDGIQTSTDGINWTPRVADNFPGMFYDVKCLQGLCVAVGENGEIQTSTDGVSWTHRDGPKIFEPNVSINGFASNGSTRIVVGSGGLIQSTTDGKTWTARTNAGAVTTPFNAATYGAGLFVVVGNNGAIQTSTDGINWTARTAAAGFTGNFLGVTYASKLQIFIAVGTAGEIQTSPDGITWTRVATGGPVAFYGVAASETLAVTVGDNGVIRTSADGANWSPSIAAGGYTGTFHGVTYGEGVFVAVGEAGELQYSANGVVWTQVSTGVAGTLYDTTYNWGTFYAVGEGNTILRSTDGITWAPRPPWDETTADIVCIGGDRYVMTAGLANFGQILTGYLN